MNRCKPELQAIDLATWPGIAWTDLDTEARKVIRQRMHALELFVQGEPVQAIEDSTGVNRRQLYRWLERGPDAGRRPFDVIAGLSVRQEVALPV